MLKQESVSFGRVDETLRSQEKHKPLNKRAHKNRFWHDFGEYLMMLFWPIGKKMKEGCNLSSILLSEVVLFFKKFLATLVKSPAPFHRKR